MRRSELDSLRAEARDELQAEIMQRCRAGEDPWQFIPDLPSVDERVIRILRSDTIDLLGLGSEWAQAYHPASPRARAEEFEFALLRRIALDHPDLTQTVWSMLGRFDPNAA